MTSHRQKSTGTTLLQHSGSYSPAPEQAVKEGLLGEVPSTPEDLVEPVRPSKLKKLLATLGVASVGVGIGAVVATNTGGERAPDTTVTQDEPVAPEAVLPGEEYSGNAEPAPEVSPSDVPETPEVIDPLTDPFSPESVALVPIEELTDYYRISGEAASTPSEFASEFVRRLESISNLGSPEEMEPYLQYPRGGTYAQDMLPRAEAAATGLLGAPNAEAEASQALMGAYVRDITTEILNYKPEYKFSTVIDGEPVITQNPDGSYNLVIPVHSTDNCVLQAKGIIMDATPVDFRGDYYIQNLYVNEAGIWELTDPNFILKPSQS